MEVFDYLRGDSAHVVGEVQSQLLLSAKVPDEAKERASDRESVSLFIFEELKQLLWINILHVFFVKLVDIFVFDKDLDLLHDL